jgi:CheY-like chemotaxis protein
MAQNQDALLLRDAVAAAKQGNKSAARQMLRQASVHNPNNELVWLWRASLSESPKEAVFYLGEVLRINPNNQKAAAWLEKCKPQPTHKPTGAPASPAPSERPAPAQSTHTATSFSAPVPPPSPSPTQGLQALAKGAELSNRPAIPMPAAGTARPEPAPAATPTPAISRLAEAISSPAAPRHGEPIITPPPAMSKTTTEHRPAETHINAPRPGEAAKFRPTVIPFATRSSPAPAISVPQAASKWKCPFCSHPSEDPIRKCPTCRAVTVLEDLKEVEKNEGVVERLVREAIARLERTPADKRDFSQHAQLALAHLNLREATSAIPHLKSACAARRNDWTLVGILDQIQWRKVVLVVDDSLTVRKALASTLEKNEYRVVLAEDGSHALARLNEAVPDLVLLDITMPWMDGYQVCKTIKEKALTRKVPVIMLSGKDGLFDKVRGRLAGANDYLTKPFQTENLLKTIKKYLS